MDFSKAQKKGFIKAFTDLFLSNKDSRNRKKLRDIGEKLIQECRKHFRRLITRCSKISGMVPISKRDKFIIKAQKLMEIKLLDRFQSIV